MHKQRIQVVEIAAVFEEPGPERRALPVAVEKGLAEGAEQGAEGELDLRIGVIDGRVDETGDAPVPAQDVAGPHVSVNEGRLGAVVTPPVADGALPGVMRGEVLAAAGAEERSLKPEDLARASEAFVTNCLGIRALVSVDGAPIGDGRPGAVFEKFRAIP